MPQETMPFQYDADTLYRLLPAIYRIRDADEGEPLKALMQVIAEQMVAMEENLAQLYDDQFIETCAEWVVPYIGDLIGVRGIYQATEQVASPHAPRWRILSPIAGARAQPRFWSNWLGM